MKKLTLRRDLAFILIALLVLLAVTLACARTVQDEAPPFWSVSAPGVTYSKSGQVPVAQAADLPAQLTPSSPLHTPTPDQPRPLPTIRADPVDYSVEKGDTLGTIAKRYGVGLEQIEDANKLANPNFLHVGQALSVPPPTPDGTAPDFKIIPDSEMVYGPSNVSFDLESFIQSQGGYLAGYKEEVNNEPLTGAQIVERISQDFSVNPRLLLAIMEYQSGWVRKSDLNKKAKNYPVGLENPQREGLYHQLTYTANNLNRGYYLWRVGGIGAWVLRDGTILLSAPTINAGTAGVQHFFSTLLEREEWDHAVSDGGLFAIYYALFGNPFGYAIEPIIPDNLIQPPMQLPFGKGEEWSFTGGPHGGWGDGSAWAALDFAPPGDALGCVKSDAWVVAVADGLILRAGNGAVIQDLDGDGLEQTGWVVLYMHIESHDRVETGTYIRAGEHIGHPSCEGGISSGTHVHLARRYNGEWVPADQTIPFVLDRWVSIGTGEQYDGYLERGRKQVEAYAGSSPKNAITR